jgi:hypothetical protein
VVGSVSLHPPYAFIESIFWDIIATPTCRGKQSGGVSNYIASSFSPHPEIATVACGDLAITQELTKEILITIADLRYHPE